MVLGLQQHQEECIQDVHLLMSKAEEAEKVGSTELQNSDGMEGA